MIQLFAEGKYGGKGLDAFANHLRVKYKKRIEQIVERELNILLRKLKEATPKDTGAAASNVGGEGNKRDLYPGHKVVKAKIAAPYGWQMTPVKRVNINTAEYEIFNPTWLLYLKYVNKFHPTARHFVEKVWMEHLARRKERGYGD